MRLSCLPASWQPLGDFKHNITRFRCLSFSTRLFPATAFPRATSCFRYHSGGNTEWKWNGEVMLRMTVAHRIVFKLIMTNVTRLDSIFPPCSAFSLFLWPSLPWHYFTSVRRAYHRPQIFQPPIFCFFCSTFLLTFSQLLWIVF